jgi:hypothetical protein
MMFYRFLLFMMLISILTGCNAPSAAPTPAVSTPAPETPTPAPVNVAPTASAVSDHLIVIDPTTALPFDRRLLGTNVPAWLNPYRLDNETFIQRTADLGLSLLRMPGGSWSNAYAWADCEAGGDGCYWPWAAKPSDFLRFARAVNAEIIWTVSINGSARKQQHSLRSLTVRCDERMIGIDVRGRDWKTVGHWHACVPKRAIPIPFRFDTGSWQRGLRSETRCWSELFRMGLGRCLDVRPR